MRGVDLAVAAAIEAVAVGLAGADRDRREPGGAGELGVGGEALGAGDLADELGGGQRPEPGLGEQLRRDLGDEVGDLGLERVDRRRSARAGGAARRGRSGRASSARRAPGAGRSCVVHFFENNAPPGSVELGPEVVQVPLQRVVERDARADQPLAVVDQQPDVELRAGQRRRRQRLDARRQRGARDRERVDPIGLAALAARAPRRRPSAASRRERRARRGAIKNRSNAPETCRQSSSAHTRSPSRPRAQITSAANPRAPTATVLSPSTWPVAASTAAIVCERLCMSAPSTIMTLVPSFPIRMLDARRTRLAGGAATLLSSHAGHPRPATSDTTKGSQAHPGRQPQRESARRPVGTISSASDVTDTPNQNSKPRSSGRVPTGLGRASRASRYSFASMARCGRQARGLFEWPVGR